MDLICPLHKSQYPYDRSSRDASHGEGTKGGMSYIPPHFILGCFRFPSQFSPNTGFAVHK